jgi:hypothetical protein
MAFVVCWVLNLQWPVAQEHTSRVALPLGNEDVNVLSELG